MFYWDISGSRKCRLDGGRVGGVAGARKNIFRLSRNEGFSRVRGSPKVHILYFIVNIEVQILYFGLFFQQMGGVELLGS